MPYCIITEGESVSHCYCQWIVVQLSVHVHLHVMQCCLIVDEIFEQFEVDNSVIVKAIQQLELAS